MGIVQIVARIVVLMAGIVRTATAMIAVDTIVIVVKNYLRAGNYCSQHFIWRYDMNSDCGSDCFDCSDCSGGGEGSDCFDCYL